MANTYNADAQKIFYYSNEPTIQIKGNYVYAFNEGFTRAMHISEVEKMILEHGDDIE